MSRFNVKALRESMGLDRDEFSDRVGVDVRTIRRWENAEVDPSPMATRRLREMQRSLEPARRTFEMPAAGAAQAVSGVVPSRRALSE